MNLWIRSQMKNNLVSADNFHVEFNEDNYTFQITCEKWDSEYCLGEYSTEEKALKVLDMIQNYIRQCKIDDTVKHIVRRVPLDNITFQKKLYVFQMPLDNEV